MIGGMDNQLSNMSLSNNDDNTDDEFEDEEILVHVEFDCEVDHNILNHDSTFKLIGIDSENPLMQFGNKVYQGEWRDIVGTSVFLEDDEDKKNQESNADSLFSMPIEHPLKLACCTRKSLIMSRVFVKPKSDETQNESTSEDRTDSVIETKESTSEVTNEGVINSSEVSEQMDVT